MRTEPEYIPTEEVWRPVVSHPKRYEVSSEGRVRTWIDVGHRGCLVVNRRKYKLLVQTLGGRAKNYRRVHFYKPERFAFVHALVAEAFIGPRPPGMKILHRDDDGFDNRLVHLRYGYRDENELDRHVASVAPDLPPAPF